jgi:dCMP deaminase
MISRHSEYTVQIGAVIYRGNKVISVGFNKVKSHPKLANEDRFYSLHAEMSAIINAKQELKGCSIYVYREFKEGGYALAKPCNRCMATIIESGITKIFFTDTNERGYSCIKVNKNSVQQLS